MDTDSAEKQGLFFYRYLNIFTVFLTDFHDIATIEFYIEANQMENQFMEMKTVSNRKSELQRRSADLKTQGMEKHLAELKSGQTGRVVGVRGKIPEVVQELASMGIVRHASVRVVDNYDGYIVFRVEQRKFVVDKEIAAGILVRVT